ncbi:hypothetical protein DKX38_025919 [Salix brachista]|uniref:CCHC-type domain-containing protein n=1 Tax=Salix brachista TaxID=2182728 RepID=A0A5N5JVJ8_9ROSI|nr:hypothetical protein DKX38_025919 [Salix brachista]
MPPRRRVPNRIPVEEANERDRVAQLEQQMAIITEQLATLLANQNPFHGLNPNAGGAEDGSDEENEPQIEIPQLRRQAPERDDNRRWESGMRTEIPEFQGNLSPEEFLDWLGIVEEILEFKNVPADARVALVATWLRGRAAAWWQQLKIARTRMGKAKITDWEKVIQKSISRRGIGGLFAQGSSGMTGKLGSNSSSSSNRSAILGSNNGTPNILSTSNQQPRVVGGFKCFNCGEVGHRQSDCMRLGKRTLFTDTNEEHNNDTIITGEPLFDEDEEVIEDWVEGDVGPLLMVRPIYDEVATTATLKNTVLMAGELETQQLMASATAYKDVTTDHGTTMVVQRTLNRSTGFSPFQIVYSIVPRGPLDLLPLPINTRIHGKVADFVHSLQDIHAQVYENLERTVGKYKLAADKKRRHLEFDVGDFVWAILTKERFPVGEYNKLAAKKIGPLEVLEKINLNAYRLRLPSHIHTADVFNVKHLIPYSDDSSQVDTDCTSRSTFLHPGGDDAASSLALEYLERKDRSKTGKNREDMQASVRTVNHDFNSGAPELRANPKFNFDFVDDGEEVYYTYDLRDKAVFSRIVMNQTTYSRQRYSWNEMNQIWVLYAHVPKDYCDTYNLCGAHGNCISTQSPAWRLWKDGKPLELIEALPEESCNLSEVMRCINISLLCVQQHPDDRPSMSTVVWMLGGENTLPQPKEPGFFKGSGLLEPSSSSSNIELSSTNEITTSLLYPR